MNMKLPQAYIAGAYTHSDPDIRRTNVQVALLTALRASTAGYLPIVPHVMQNHHQGTWDDAMERCRYLLRSLNPAVDVMVLAAGWENSRGAREEVVLANFLGIRVIPSQELP